VRLGPTGVHKPPIYALFMPYLCPIYALFIPLISILCVFIPLSPYLTPYHYTNPSSLHYPLISLLLNPLYTPPLYTPPLYTPPVISTLYVCNREVVLAAVGSCRDALRHASREMRAEKEVGIYNLYSPIHII
jgi:hypothetical protein